MAAAKRKSVARLCLALGLFILAGVFRQMDRIAAPLPSAACFLLTNLIYIGLAMAWGFSLSRQMCIRDSRGGARFQLRLRENEGFLPEVDALVSVALCGLWRRGVYGRRD